MRRSRGAAGIAILVCCLVVGIFGYFMLRHASATQHLAADVRVSQGGWFARLDVINEGDVPWSIAEVVLNRQLEGSRPISVQISSQLPAKNVTDRFELLITAMTPGEVPDAASILLQLAVTIDNSRPDSMPESAMWQFQVPLQANS